MDRKTEIIEAAAKIIGNGGIQSFTTKRLAAHIGISEAALYRHFSGKDALIHAVFEHFERLIGIELASNIDSDMNSRQKLITIFELHKGIFQQYPELVFLLFSEGSFIDVEGLAQKIKEILIRKFSLMNTIIWEGQEKGEIRNDIESNELGKLMMGYFRMSLLQLKLEGNMDNLDHYCSSFFATLKKIM